MLDIERCHKMIRLLRSRRVVTREAFMEATGASLATFKRDLAYLKDRAGAEVEFERDLGGYVLRIDTGKEYFPGLWFSAGEIHGLLTLYQLAASLEPGLLGRHRLPRPVREAHDQRVEGLVGESGFEGVEVGDGRKPRSTRVGAREQRAPRPAGGLARPECREKARSDSERLISAVINVLFTTLVGVIFVTVYSFSVYWLIAPIFFTSIPILGFLSSVLSRRIKNIQKIIVSETTALAGSTTESLRTIELVKSLGLGNQEINRLNSTTDKILQLELKKVRYIRKLSFVQGIIVNFIRTVIMFVLLYLIFIQQITVGEFFSIFIYSFFIFGPLQSLGDLINIYREAEVSLNNFETLLNKPIESKPERPIKLGEIRNIEFQNVVFRHQSANRHAINGISFKVTEGETVAFVGPSGSGKTTLVKLLVGLYTPQDGKILFNQISGDKFDFDELREKIGFVTQDTQLFSGTIKENLLFVNPKATDADCLEVLRKAAAKDLLERAENGLDTMIGEGGIKVSGGEKQRLSIARALLRNPHLIIFDEATSALDSLTEEEISKTIRDISIRKDLITVMIAHRLSTVMHADMIHVLERGDIVESGKHEELLELKGLYYAMWRPQIRERELITNDLLSNISEN